MAFHGYNANPDESCSNWAPYITADDDGIETELQYSSPYELGESNPIVYTSSAYYRDDYYYSEPVNYTNSYNYYDYAVNPSRTSYSQPKFLQYEPTPHYQGYFPSETKFTISYSNAEFNEPEFEEYDPTPYDGGYDQRMTYGKPLPPSDLTCYPRSLSQSESPNLENFSYDSVPPPYGKDGDIPIEPPKEKKPTDTKSETESNVENEDNKVISDGKDVEFFQPIVSGDYERDFGQIPYGSGLEAVDICESIFGYWPCLAKIEQQRKNCQVCDQDRRVDQWKTAADYFFGSAIPYDYENYHHQQSPYQNS